MPETNENTKRMAAFLALLRYGRTSTAAGAYAITNDTYEWAVSHGIAHDFSEAFQDAIALGIIHRAGADPAIRDQHLEAAFARHVGFQGPPALGRSRTASSPFFMARL